MSFPLTLSRPLTWVDLETTSNVPSLARICEIAVVQQHPDGSLMEWWSVINPGVPIPAEATAIHGIADEHVLGKPRFEDVAQKLIRAFQHCDYAGFNVRYDVQVLDAEFKRVGISTEVPEGAHPPRILDGYRLWQLSHPRTLTDYIRVMVGRDHDGAHGAVADIKGTIEAVAAHLGRYPEVFAGTLDELHDKQFPKPPGAVDALGKVAMSNGRPHLTFGKHAYIPLQQVPRSYLTWLLTTELAADLRTIIDNALRGVYPV